MDYVYAYEGLNQPVQELKYLSAYIKAKPNATNQNGLDLVKWRDALEKQLNEKT